jgi:hypothetical protein
MKSAAPTATEVKPGLNDDTLRGLRDRSNLTIAQIIEKARETDPNFPRTHVGLLEIEQRGTRDYWKIHALAAVYGRTPEEIAEVAKPAR